MKTTPLSNEYHDAIAEWWEQVESRLPILAALLEEELVLNDVAGIPKVQAHLRYLTAKLKQISYPPAAREPYHLLMSSIQHLNLSLENRIHNNAYESQLFLEMGQNDMNSLRYRLVSIGILVSPT